MSVYVHAKQRPWAMHPTCPLKGRVALFLHSCTQLMVYTGASSVSSHPFVATSVMCAAT